MRYTVFCLLFSLQSMHFMRLQTFIKYFIHWFDISVNEMILRTFNWTIVNQIESIRKPIGKLKIRHLLMLLEMITFLKLFFGCPVFYFYFIIIFFFCVEQLNDCVTTACIMHLLARGRVTFYVTQNLPTMSRNFQMHH